ncbi:MAG: tRNA uridine-5-carboxymethylaminomethyl(34) synthesis GTPase MnmE [Gammaproteobacteria bacterium]|nr:tRNA uridine-5-carboxymethylaminomethyl(34) synthesis GTPase MnmE [Gammaproteobacteria bacterium]
MDKPSDTIAALSTAPGTAAIAVVRLTGPDALQIATRLTGITPPPRRAVLATFKAPDGAKIDQGLVLYFPAPNSYTGEDVVELHGHGSAVVTDWLLETLYAHGARPAEPGEFTLRAFLNDKLDLAQAEAVADLIESGSRAAAQAALRSLDGAFSNAVERVREALVRLRVHVEGWLDFPDEELDLDTAAGLEARLEEIIVELDALIARVGTGRVLRDGLTVVIAGPPNAGKSSLLNTLAGYEAAIVTQIPGTTRDPLREHLSLDGLPVTLIDTAGLRESTDPIEAEGVKRAQRELERADLVLWMIDASDGTARADMASPAALGSQRVTLVLNKIDLTGESPGAFEQDGMPGVRLSVKTGDGLSLLTEHVKSRAGWRGDAVGTFSARRRHLEALERAARHLRAARGRFASELEIGAEELRAAQNALAEVTGEFTTDDLLGEIFATFCIGK